MVVAHDKNTGKGCAVKNALRYAVEHGFDALVLLDGDDQHDPNEILQLLVPITNDTADIVIGFRTLNQMPAYRGAVMNYELGLLDLEIGKEKGGQDFIEFPWAYWNVFGFKFNFKIPTSGGQMFRFLGAHVILK